MGNVLPDYQELMPRVIHAACVEGKTNSQIGADLGYPAGTIRMWLARPEYQEAAKQFYEQLTEEMTRYEVVHRTNRIALLQKVLDKMVKVIEDRAFTHSEMTNGAATGLLVKQYKSIGSGPNAYEVAEWHFDSTLVEKILAIQKQVAQETGQWSEKSEVKINSEQVKVIRFVAQERKDPTNPTNPTDPELLSLEDGVIDVEYENVS